MNKRLVRRFIYLSLKNGIKISQIVENKLYECDNKFVVIMTKITKKDIELLKTNELIKNDLIILTDIYNKNMLKYAKIVFTINDIKKMIDYIKR